MKKIEESESLLIKSYYKEIEKFIDYLKIDLSELNIESSIIFGSVTNNNFFEKNKSDIDIVAYSKDFSLSNVSNFIEIINSVGGKFLDKEPIFLSDFISPRIEYFFQIDNIVFDVNIFPSYFYGFDKINTNVVHDSIDVVIGAMYENAILLFGKSPIEDFIKKYAYPFYSDDICNNRMNLLNERIYKLNKSIQKKINEGNIDVLKELYKSRGYFLKYLFIKNKKYPVDLNNFIEYQLSNFLNLPKNEIDILLFKGESIKIIVDNYINYVYKVM